MATGEYLEGIIDDVPYKISDLDGNGQGLERRLKSKFPIPEGEFYLFSCFEDSTSNRIKTITELNEKIIQGLALNNKEKYIVQIVINPESDDFGLALLKLFENFSYQIKNIIQLEIGGERKYIHIKNQGITHFISSSDAFDFYKRIYKFFIDPSSQNR